MPVKRRLFQCQTIDDNDECVRAMITNFHVCIVTVTNANARHGRYTFRLSPPPFGLRVVRSANVGTSGGYSVYDDRTTFYAALAAFLEDGDNSRFVSDIVYTGDEEIKVMVHV